MQNSNTPRGDAALARDAAASRLRRLTVGAFAGASALAIGIAGVAAATTHTRKAVARAVTVTTLPAVKVTAPSATPAGGAAAAVAAAPQQTPAAAYTQPVATSGGS